MKHCQCTLCTPLSLIAAPTAAFAAACQGIPALLLQVLDFPQAKAAKAFVYDHEWLATLRSTHHLFTLDRRQRPLPGEAASIRQTRFAVHALRAAPVSATACPLYFVSGSPPRPEKASLHGAGQQRPVFNGGHHLPSLASASLLNMSG